MQIKLFEKVEEAMSEFFDPRGNSISKDEFVHFYSECYYLYCSDVVEREIEEYLKSDGKITSPMDVMKILEWKLGRINYKKSQTIKTTCYKHPDLMQQFVTQTRSGKINAKKICEHIARNYDSLSKMSPEEILEELKADNVENLGSVYLITLIYFITKGEYPIFDRFAQMAVSAIVNDKEPGSYIPQTDLPSRTSKNIIEKCNEIYVNPLKSVFQDEYKIDRNIDRALWVYGHLFESDKSKANF